MKLLNVVGLSVEIEGKEVLRGVDLKVGKGELLGLTGENGSGKTTLSQVLMGSTQYVVCCTQLLFDGNNLLELKVEERARAGLYVSWQNPIAVPGVSVFNLCKASYLARGLKIESLVAFRAKLEELLEQVGLPKNYVERGVNVGMSGGERKRLELVLMLLFEPKLVVLDEIDSGLDMEGREMVIKMVKELNKKGTTFLVISHYPEFLRAIGVKRIITMNEGRIK